LAVAEDEPLDAGRIDAIVREVTAPARARPQLLRPRTWSTGLRVAALLVGLLLVTAAAVVLAPAALWPEAARSSESMDYSQAVELLRQPKASLNARSSALRQTFQRARYGIQSIRALVEDAATPETLRAGATEGLGRLRDVLAGTELRRGGQVPSDRDLVASIELMQSTAAAIEEREAALSSALALLTAGVQVIRDAIPLYEDLRLELGAAEDYLRRLLR
jgi:hypothetical protein